MASRAATTGGGPTFFNLAENIRRSSTGLDPALVAASLRDAVANGALAAADAALGPAAVAPDEAAREAAAAHTLDAFGGAARLYTRALAPWMDPRSHDDVWADAPTTPFYAPLRCLRIEIPLPLTCPLAVAPVTATSVQNADQIRPVARRRARPMRADNNRHAADDHGRDPDSESEGEGADVVRFGDATSGCGASPQESESAFPFGVPPLERLRRNLDAWHAAGAAFDSRRALADLADERSAATRLLSEQLVNLSSRYRFGLDDVCAAPHVVSDGGGNSPRGNSPGSPLAAALSPYEHAAIAAGGAATSLQLGRWVEAACDAYKRFGRLARDAASVAAAGAGPAPPPAAGPPILYMCCRYHPVWGSFVAMFFVEAHRRMVALTADSPTFRRTLTRAGFEVGVAVEWLDGAALIGVSTPSTVGLFAGSAAAAGGAQFIVSDATSVVFDFLVNLGFASPIEEDDHDPEETLSPLGGHSPYSPISGGGGHSPDNGAATYSGGMTTSGGSKVWRLHPQGQGGLDSRLAALAPAGVGAGGVPSARKAPVPVAPYMSIEATFPFSLGELRQARLRRFISTRHVSFPDRSAHESALKDGGGSAALLAASPVTNPSLGTSNRANALPAVAALRHLVFILEPRAANAAGGGSRDAAAASAAGAFLLPHVLYSAPALVAARGVRHMSLLPDVAFSPSAATAPVTAGGGASGGGGGISGGGSSPTNGSGMAALAPLAAGGSRRDVGAASPLSAAAPSAAAAGRQWVGLSRVSCMGWLCQSQPRAGAPSQVEGAPEVTPGGENPAEDCEFAPHVLHIMIQRGPWAPQRACVAVHTLRVFGASDADEEEEEIAMAQW